MQAPLVSHCTKEKSSLEDGESSALVVQSKNWRRTSDDRFGRITSSILVPEKMVYNATVAKNLAM